VEPAAQMYPAVQFPLHVGTVSAGALPKDPGAHSAVHVASGIRSVAPYRPIGQSMQSPARAKLYRPAGHTTCVATTAPAGHAWPGWHMPVQFALVNALVFPKVPALHSEHTAEPMRLYWPGGHVNAVALVEPGAHAYPARQMPLQADTFRPVALPNQPPSHGPLHPAVGSASWAPYRPTGHMSQADDPDSEYWPKGHADGVELVDPAAQM
jgi:hypothetical protein